MDEIEFEVEFKDQILVFFFVTFFFEINSFHTYKTFNLTTWPISIYSLIYLTIVDFTWVSHMPATPFSTKKKKSHVHMPHTASFYMH